MFSSVRAVIAVAKKWLVCLATALPLFMLLAGSGHAQPSQLDPTVTQVASGQAHSCAVTAGGGVQCWGYNGLGQLGNNSTTNSLTPVAVSGLASGVVAVTAGSLHSCALSTGGGVQCWGDNFSGQLGNNSSIDSHTPVAVSGLAGVGTLGGVAAIAAGYDYTCALSTGGGVLCWGYNATGQLGNNSTTNSLTPVAVSGLASGVVAITVGQGHSCALSTGGGVQCWGRNINGQLGNNSVTESHTPVAVSGPAGVGTLTGVAAITAGDYHTCALSTGGGVLCWGGNDEGQLGNNTYNAGATPTPVVVSGVAGVGTLAGVAAIAAGTIHTCALTTGGAVLCWGYKSTTSINTPEAISGLASGMVAITAGGFFSCALTTGGGVQCWGENNLGRLGNDSTSPTLPVSVSGLAGGVAAITAGDAHSCAVSPGGRVQCWGSNVYGQLGNNSTTGSPTPVAVSGLASGVPAITAGHAHSCAVTGGGVHGVQCWGENNYGQLGNNSTTESHTPVAVSGPAGVGALTGVAAITAGDYHTCALTTGGGAQCWGNNNNGQLGNNSTTYSLTPVAVSGPAGVGTLTGVLAITAAAFHTCALTTGGGVQCWGNNGYGQLGNNSFTNSLTPVAVSGPAGVGTLTGVVAITAANTHACALSTGGGVQCWGRNNLGQLGNNSITNSSTPVAVSGLASGVAAITTGFFYTCALTTGGAVQCWGSNRYGQLGNNSITNSLTPVAVSGLGSGVVAITAGQYHTCALSTGGGIQCWGLNTDGQLGNNSITDSLTPTPVKLLSAQSISFNAPPRLLLGAAATPLTATATSGLSATFDTWTPGTCSVSGNTVTALAPALCGLRASQGGDIASQPAPQKLVLINVVPSYSISVTASPLIGGSVSCTPNPVAQGDSSVCTASANSGYTFSTFSGDCTGASPCTLSNVTSNKAVTATFTLNSYPISTSASPSAGGSVTCTPNPVNHGSNSTCTASANSGYTFSAFSGDCTGATCTLSNVTSAKAVTATFTLNSYPINSTASPIAGGTVTCTPNPVNHGSNSTCSASAATGYAFSAFSGDCTGASPCTLSNVSSAKAVTATFTLNSYPITGTASPGAGGTVTCTPNPVNHGSNSTCTASATTGYAFSAFSGDCTGASCTLSNVTSAKAVTATFTLIVSLNVDLSVGPTKYLALSDGQLVLRYMLGMTGTALTAGALGSTAQRSDPTDIINYLNAIRPQLDIDGNTLVDAATDGVLIIRYMLGFRGDTLITGAIGSNPTRSSVQAIEAWLANLMP